MTTAAVPERPIITVPARQLATGWLNAFLAASQDAERPILYRTLSLEFFPRGVQLVGCDGTALIRAFVPTIDGVAWPDVDLTPQQSVIVKDPDHFGASFMRILLQVTNDDAHRDEPLTISTITTDDDAAPALGTAFQRERLVLRACGQRLDLQLMEATYPGWRALDLGVTGERVKELRIAPRLLAMLGKLKAVTALDLQFHGIEKHIGVAGKGLVAVRGLIMPMRKAEEEQAAKAPEATDESDEVRTRPQLVTDDPSPVPVCEGCDNADPTVRVREDWANGKMCDTCAATLAREAEEQGAPQERESGDPGPWEGWTPGDVPPHREDAQGAPEATGAGESKP